jgi:hypothetical protein
MFVRCAKNESDPDHVKYKRVPGGFDSLLRFKPIYFHDSSYRHQRHDFVTQMVIADEREMKELNFTEKAAHKETAETTSNSSGTPR